MRRYLRGAATAAAVLAGAVLLPLASSAYAATITDVFSFNNGTTQVATGSFSYDSSLSGTLSYSDLGSFQITILGAPTSQPDQTYNLSFVQSLVNSGDYVWFAYNTVSNTFDAGVPTGYQGPFPSILAGLVNQGGQGFFFDAPSSYPGGDNQYAGYNPVTNGCFASCPTYVSFSISETPLPSTWTMLIAGFAGFGFLAYRGTKNKGAAALAAA